jgi:hypothetical protein
VQGCHLLTGPVTQQNRQAIGHLRRASHSTGASLRAVGLHAIGRTAVRLDHFTTVHLVQKNRSCTQGRAQLRTVGRHARRFVADALTHVETVKGRQAGTTGAGRADRPDANRCWP